MRRTSWIFVFGLIAILHGCIKPHYDKQYVDVPDSWRITPNEASTLCNVRWWEEFHDPVLNALILQSLKYNQDLQVAISRVFEYYARLGVVNSALYPELDGNASAERLRVSNAFFPPPLPPGINPIDNDFLLYFSLNWELDFWGRIRSASEAAYADVLSQTEARRAVVITVVKSVADAYVILRKLDGQLEVSKKTLESRLESLKLAQFRFELGETSEIEVKQAESEVEIAAISVIEFQRAIPQQENLLSVLVGENPRSMERGLTIEAFSHAINVPAGLPSDLLTRRPDIIEAEDKMIAANARVTEARALYFPKITLTGLFGNESDQLKNLFSGAAQTWQYGVNVFQPIFNAGKTYFQVKAAEEFRNEMLFNYRQTILNAFREVDDALIACVKNQELVREHRKQVKILNEYLHLAQLRYNEGEIDYLNVLDAERALFNAELSQVQSQADNFTAVVELYSALGGGWVYDADAYALSNVVFD